MASATVSPTGSSLWSKAFWKGAAERAVKTFAQSAVAVLTADIAGLLNVDFAQLGSVAGLAALVSLLTSVSNHDFVAGRADPVVVLPVAPAPEAVAIPDGDGKYRAEGSGSSVASGPVIHEGGV